MMFIFINQYNLIILIQSAHNYKDQLPFQYKMSNNTQNSQHNLQELEQLHKNQIISTFLNYQSLCKKTNLSLYSQSRRIQKIGYYKLIQQKKRTLFQQAIQCNQNFLNEIIDFCQGQQKINDLKENENVSFNNFSKIKSTIKQFFREWSDQGTEYKDYQKIVNIAKKYLHKADKVLTPGSGLGRLVLEFVQAGFGCQGNQVSYFMLYSSNFILNAVQHEKQYKIYPFINSTDYYEDQNDIFRSVMIPDKAAINIVQQDADFSMAAGQFTQVYDKLVQQFNCVATCFFIDTANNIFEYVNTIHKTLKQKGIWINYGPLLFHYRQVYKQVSIEVSWQILKQYISSKFQFLQEEIQETTYCHDPKAQMGVTYSCLMFVCKKK